MIRFLFFGGNMRRPWCGLVLALWLGRLPLQAQPLALLVTGDSHGWLESVGQADGSRLGGAGETLEAWRARESFDAVHPLVLSCGDNYTGPSISTYFKGASVPGAMRAMGYQASALGNHEFDFGVAQLASLTAASGFPTLACNLTRTAASAQDLPVQPFVIVQTQGLKVGVVGLTLKDLAKITDPAGWDGTDYAAALRLWVPRARQAGAQVVVVVAHVPYDDLKAVAAQVRDLDIPVFFGGHSHEITQGRTDSGAWVVNAGSFWREYARVDLDCDTVTGRAEVRDVHLEMVEGPPASAATEAEIGLPPWQKKLKAAAGPVLGHTRAGLHLPWQLANFITDTWLRADPKADVALCNLGGIRQDLYPGDIDRLTLLSALPFEDGLVEVTVPGDALLNLLSAAGKGFWHKQGEIMMPAGLHEKGSAWVLDKTGKAVDPSAHYRLLINTYMKAMSPQTKGLHGVLVAKNWREPLVEFLKAHPTTDAKPLEDWVDAAPRAAE
jgi:2',3'-cyclic-nucleotide 2'-phosphodiesterase (5'-nucleotidase family)